MSAVSNPTWCGKGRHERTGLVSNLHPDVWLIEKDEPLSSVTVCHRQECQEKAMRYVAGQANRQAFYFDDAERRAAKTAVTR